MEHEMNDIKHVYKLQIHDAIINLIVITKPGFYTRVMHENILSF